MRFLKRRWWMALVLASTVCTMGCGSLKPYHYFDDTVTGNSGVPNNCGKDGTAGSCKTVVIGDQTWMAENLNREIGKSWCYGNNDSLCNKFGRLYDVETAAGACPAGYHLPSRAEWEKLVATVGGSSVAGKRLKSARNWYKNGTGTDDYGFSALPGGYYHSGGDGRFFLAGADGYWWTDEGSWVMWHNNDGVFKSPFGKGNYLGFSVRCVQDINEEDLEDSDELYEPAVVSNGDSYESVMIGGMTWMTKNLNIATKNSWCYDNNPDSCEKYGRLYTWSAAKRVCPKGWRLPDTADWRRLVRAAGGVELEKTISGIRQDGGQKLRTSNGWKKYTAKEVGTNEMGFFALPGGSLISVDYLNEMADDYHKDLQEIRAIAKKSDEAADELIANMRRIHSLKKRAYEIQKSRTESDNRLRESINENEEFIKEYINMLANNPFVGAGEAGRWWTATAESAENAFIRFMGWEAGNYVYEMSNDKRDGMSVRCRGE